jgi:hypothetical protein
VKNGQQRVLGSLLSSARLTRLVEQETIDGDGAYRPVDFLGDVRRGIWSEVYADGPVLVDAYRRNLQRAYIETLAERVNGPQANPDDARALFRGELKTLEADLKTAASRTTDRTTRLHLEDIQVQIARALDPSVQAPGTATPARSPTDFDVTIEPESCWTDFAIRGNSN